MCVRFSADFPWILSLNFWLSSSRTRRTFSELKCRMCRTVSSLWTVQWVLLLTEMYAESTWKKTKISRTFTEMDKWRKGSAENDQPLEDFYEHLSCNFRVVTNIKAQ